MAREAGQGALFGDLIRDLAETLPAAQELLDRSAREDAESVALALSGIGAAADPAFAALLLPPEIRLGRLSASMSLLATERRGRGWSLGAGLSLIPVGVGVAVLDRESVSRAWRISVEVEQVTCDAPIQTTP